MSNLELGKSPHTATEHSNGETTDCNNDLVLQGITDLKKDLGEVKGDINSIKIDIAETKGDIKVIDHRLSTLDKTVDKNSDGIDTLNKRNYLIFGGSAMLAFVVTSAINLFNSGYMSIILN